jgi:hypothetical protein
MKTKSIRIPSLLISCLLGLMLVSLVGCASDESHSSSSQSSATDSKDMKDVHHRSQNNTH